MRDAERLSMVRLNREVMAETDFARLKLPEGKSIEELPLVYGITALVEEIGKLARCTNKLVVAEDPGVILQWTTERRTRIITAMSLLERLYGEMERRPT